MLFYAWPRSAKTYKTRANQGYPVALISQFHETIIKLLK